jgi:hypothetical protein
LQSFDAIQYLLNCVSHVFSSLDVQCGILQCRCVLMAMHAEPQIQTWHRTQTIQIGSYHSSHDSIH